jgi:pimeloyl-ACP methyl ester carboxylesterase
MTPPLVLLHAFPFDRRLWARVTPLVRGREVIAPDLRGFGGQPPAGAFSIADLADDVVALLDARGLDRAIVGGISMGGYVALAFAARHPTRLAGLLLADTKAGPDTPEARQARGEAIALVETSGVAALVDKQLPRLLAPGATPEVRAEARAIAVAQRPGTLTAALAALRDRPDRTLDLAAIAVPTLAIVGTEDSITPPAEARAMAAAIPGARLVEIAGAGHLAALEAPQAFAAALASVWT